MQSSTKGPERPANRLTDTANNLYTGTMVNVLKYVHSTSITYSNNPSPLPHPTHPRTGSYRV